MGFKLSERFEKLKEERYNLKYITIDGEDKEVHVSKLEDKSVTSEMKSKMRMHSYAQEDLPPKLTDEALIDTVKHYVNNCSRPSYPCTTYNEAVIHSLVPELIKRLEEKNRESGDLHSEKLELEDEIRMHRSNYDDSYFKEKELM